MREHGVVCIEKWSQKPNWTSGMSSIYKNIEKHMRRPMMPSWCTMWPLESNLILKKVDSMSNESPNKVLQDARAYYLSQRPNSWRIPVFISIHAAAVRSWPSKSATPSEASWSQFESVNDYWHLKRKPVPSPSIFTYTLQPLNEQVIA